MNTFLAIFGFGFIVLILFLASVGGAALTGLLDGLQQWLYAKRVTKTDQQIVDLGRAAQLAILQEALRRAATAGSRTERPNDEPRPWP